MASSADFAAAFRSRLTVFYMQDGFDDTA